MIKNLGQHTYIVCIASFVILFSCKEEAVDHSFLHDKWSVIEAYRNNAFTTTLEEGFFHITDDTTLITNIFGEETPLAVEINDAGWKQLSPQEVQYNVTVRDNDTLEVSAEIQGFLFDFVLARDTSVVIKTQ